MTTAFITGASGFCGSHLAKRLRDEGTRVVGIGRSAEFIGRAFFDDYASVDIMSKSQLADVVRRWKPDGIFHLAGRRQGSADEIERVNVMGTRNLLEAAYECCRTARLLLVGSAAEYGPTSAHDLPITEAQPCRPQDPYGQSKYQATRLGIDYASRGMHVTVARPFNIIGAGIGTGLFLGDVLRRIDELLRTGKPLILRVGNLEAKRDFVSVEDTVNAYINLIERETAGHVFNVCSGVACSMLHVLNLLLENVPSRITVRVDPQLYKPNDVPVSFGSYAKAERAIGYRPKKDLAASVADAWRCWSQRKVA
jgi:GDP-4-dehydro-6-deoxy-D-mannose reductase